MVTTSDTLHPNIKHPLNLSDQDFVNDKYAYYRWLREEAPVYKGKVSVLNAYFLSRYEDCVNMLKDPRFVRNRSNATGKGGSLPFPLPKHIRLVAQNMILEDEPEHRRLRNLVHKAFTPRVLRKMESRIEALTHELLDKHRKGKRLTSSRPTPTRFPSRSSPRWSAWRQQTCPNLRAT